MERKDLLNWICVFNLDYLDYCDDQLLGDILKSAEQSGENFQYIAVTKCGSTVENCRMIFNVTEITECNFTSDDIEAVFCHIEVLNYVEFSFCINNIGHEFVVAKDGDEYLIIQSFIGVYDPRMTIIGPKELVQFLGDLVKIAQGSREELRNWIFVDIGDIEVTSSELYVRIPTSVINI